MDPDSREVQRVDQAKNDEYPLRARDRDVAVKIVASGPPKGGCGVTALVGADGDLEVRDASDQNTEHQSRSGQALNAQA